MNEERVGLVNRGLAQRGAAFTTTSDGAGVAAGGVSTAAGTAASGTVGMLFATRERGPGAVLLRHAMRAYGDSRDCQSSISSACQHIIT